MSLRTQSTPGLHSRASKLLALAAILIFASTRMQADTGTCNGQSLTLPFNDVPGTNIFFCSIAQAFFTGLTSGTTATTYSPAANVTREQMAAFITRTQDSALKRVSPRATAGQWSTPKDVGVLNTTAVGSEPRFSCFDGADIWVPNTTNGTVTRVRASDGRVLESWTGAINAHNTIAAAGFIYVTRKQNPGSIYRINPTGVPGAMSLVEEIVGANPTSITFDGLNLWTANQGAGAGSGSITRYNIVTDTETTFNAFSQPTGIDFDGTHLWVHDIDVFTSVLHRVNPTNGAILETISLGVASSSIPVFDGSNIWVPIRDGVAVVSISTPARLVATLTGNGLDGNNDGAAFDGERIMVTNSSGNGMLSLWKASSLTPLGNLDPGAEVSLTGGVCSDGLNFWISVTTAGTDFLMRF